MKWSNPSTPVPQQPVDYAPTNVGVPFCPAGIHSVPTVIKNFPARSHREPPPPPMPGEGLERAVNYYADYGGCGFWRMIWPEFCINAYQKAVISGSSTMIADPRYYESVRGLKFQRQATKPQLDFVRHLRNNVCNRTGMRMIYEIDDVVFKDDIPDYNRCKDAFNNDEIVNNILQIMNEVDEITVTCEYMRQYYIDKTGHSNVTVIPNYAPKFWADRFYDPDKLKTNFTKNKKRPRIGYTGSGTHFDVLNRVNQKDDFSHVVDTIAKTRKDFKWVFMGGIPLKLKPFVDSGDIEFHPWRSLLDYPQAIADLNVNCLIAPLQDNEFNRCKSNIKHLEGATQGIPTICQDMVTYEECPNIFSTGEELIDQIKLVTSDINKYMKISKQSYEFASKHWLEDHIDEHMESYFVKETDPRPNLSKRNPRFLKDKTNLLK